MKRAVMSVMMGVFLAGGPALLNAPSLVGALLLLAALAVSLVTDLSGSSRFEAPQKMR